MRLLSMVSGTKMRNGWAKPRRKRTLLYIHPVDISRSIPSIAAHLRALSPFRIKHVTRDVSIDLSKEEKTKTKE